MRYKVNYRMYFIFLNDFEFFVSYGILLLSKLLWDVFSINLGCIITLYF